MSNVGKVLFGIGAMVIIAPVLWFLVYMILGIPFVLLFGTPFGNIISGVLAAILVVMVLKNRL